jgi:hypothetical protein
VTKFIDRIASVDSAVARARLATNVRRLCYGCATLRAKRRNFATSTSPMIEAEISSPRRHSKNPSSRFDSDV